jgi:hypothetical protein
LGTNLFSLAWTTTSNSSATPEIHPQGYTLETQNCFSSLEDTAVGRNDPIIITDDMNSESPVYYQLAS